eukprot:2408343-Heterocapsa_arctica.AAC.1
MGMTRKKPPPEPPLPPQGFPNKGKGKGQEDPFTARWSAGAKAHFEAKARKEACEAVTAQRARGPRRWNTAPMSPNTR